MTRSPATDAPEGHSPASGGRECEGPKMDFDSSRDADSPAADRRGWEISESDGAVGPSGGPASKSSAAMKVQKVYRSYRTRRMLADSAVVVEELWWQAIDYARLNLSTISFFNFSKPETAASRWNRIRLNASKVGKGLSKDAKAQKLAFQHWIEAIDPRHRYGHSLHIYYEEWCKTDAGQPFFYCTNIFMAMLYQELVGITENIFLSQAHASKIRNRYRTHATYCCSEKYVVIKEYMEVVTTKLDIGDGKEVDLEECPRSKLRQQCIRYLGPQEREHSEYIVVEGKIVHKQSGNFLHTKKGMPGAKWIFVMSTSKKLYAGQKKKGIFHHSSFLAGGASLAAGRLEAEDGMLKSISPYSGHYRPTIESLDSFLSFLKEKGVNLDEVEGGGYMESNGLLRNQDFQPVQHTFSGSSKKVECQCQEIRKANEDYENFEGSKSSREEIVAELFSNLDFPQPGTSKEEEKDVSSELAGALQTETKNNYKRTLSGGLQSPRAEVPKTAILERINSKKAARSYQLGHQLSRKWSTGAGPRIGCVADYPVELRLQALELVNLSPRTPPTPSSYRHLAGLSSPTGFPASDPYNKGHSISTV